MRKLTVVFIAIFACGLVTHADQLAKGDNELNFTFSYSDVSVDGGGGDSKSADLSGSWGYLLTNHHEIGGILMYSKLDIDSGPDTDSNAIGAFYDFNFQAGESTNPYVGAHYLMVGGDAGDMVDNQYGLRAGVKVYPWMNGGFNFGLQFDKFTGADSFPDGDSVSLFGGILVKWGNQ